MMKKIFLYIFIPCLLWSCESWLDVKPYDRVAEEVAFSSVKGFENALNGIYLELNQNSLYGRNLSCETIEIMAQRYLINSQVTYNDDLQKYKYGEEANKQRFTQIWQMAYKLIANTNFLLKNCDQYREVISDEYYNTIKGEALALRALLHFDIYRLYGPMQISATGTELPYYKFFTMDKAPNVKPEVFMEYVIDDLTQAAALLQDDVVKEQGARALNTNPFYSKRLYRMNYYAVQLLLARAQLYRGNKAEALAASKEVIDVQELYFPWTDRTAVSADRPDADRTFAREILFGLQNKNTNVLYTSFFDATIVNSMVLLAPLNTEVRKVFTTSDYRYIAYLATQHTTGTNKYSIFEKYRTSEDTLSARIIPMLRVSEAYYIAAECEEDPAAGMAWLNKVLTARGVKTITKTTDLLPNIENEYIREFWGEGQLFYYYKRNKKAQLTSPDGLSTLSMTNEQYQVPIPQDESKYN